MKKKVPPTMGMPPRQKMDTPAKPPKDDPVGHAYSMIASCRIRLADLEDDLGMKEKIDKRARPTTRTEIRQLKQEVHELRCLVRTLVNLLSSTPSHAPGWSKVATYLETTAALEDDPS